VDQETSIREGWWEELRTEIKSHARALCCTHIVGYSETCTIYGEVIVLIATGTAARLKDVGHELWNAAISEGAGAGAGGGYEDGHHEGGGGGEEPLRSAVTLRGSQQMLYRAHSMDSAGAAAGLPPFVGGGGTPQERGERVGSTGGAGEAGGAGAGGPYRLWRRPRKPCFAAHVPYNRNMAPFAFMRLVPCAMCRRKWVPEFILTSTEPPPGLPVRGDGHMLEVVVCRARRCGQGEQDAVRVSEVLPFVEFDIQRQLMLKLKLAGVNAAFNYRSDIKISEHLIVATATVTAVYLEALPPPGPVQIALQQVSDADTQRRVAGLQRDIDALYKAAKTVRARDALLSRSTRSRSSSSSSSSSSGSSSSSSSSSSSTGTYTSSEDDDIESVSLSRPSSSSSSSSSSSDDEESRVRGDTERGSEAPEMDRGSEADPGAAATAGSLQSAGVLGEAAGGAGSSPTSRSRRRSHSNSSETPSQAARAERGSGGAKERRRERKHSAPEGRKGRAGSITASVPSSSAQKVTTKGNKKGVFVDDRHPYILEV
jgi:hypothetical protein